MGCLVRTGSLQNTYLLVCLAGVLTLGLILKGYYDGKRISELTAPQLSAIREAHLEATAAQHEVIHQLSNQSPTTAVNVFQHLDQTLWYLQSLLESDDYRARKWRRSTDKVSNDRFPLLDQHLTEIKTFFREHRGKKIDPDELGVVLNRNDELFSAFWNQLDAIEAEAVKSMSRDRMLFKISHYALILFGVALTLAVALTIRRYERQRARDFHALQDVNLKLVSRNESLERTQRALKESDAALRGSEELFRGLFESAVDYIHILDLNDRIVQSNPAAIKRLGVSMADLRHRRLSDFVASGEQNVLAGILDTIYSDGQFNQESSLVAHDGGTIKVDCSAFPVRDGDGKIQFIVVFQKDITDRKLTEQKLQTSYEFLKITNRHRSMQQMLDEFIGAVCSRTGCSGCAVRIIEENGTIPYAAYNGLNPQLCQIENSISIESDRSLCARVVRSDIDSKHHSFTSFGSYYLRAGKPGSHGDIEELMACQRKACLRHGYRSLALIPIRVDQQTLGLIQVADEREGVLPRPMVEILESGAMQLGPAIQRVRAEEALKAAYSGLEERINKRTLALSVANRELKAEVDERRSVERRLRDSRNTLQTLIDGIKDVLILVDGQMRIRMYNSAASDFYGIPTMGIVIGQHCYQAMGNDDLCDGCRIPQAVENGRMLTFERNNSNGSERVEQVTIYPVAKKGGRPGGAIMRIVDITEEKRFEQQMIQNEKMASLGILVSSIAHEINNPNNFITFNIPILKDYLEELIEISDQYAEKNPDLELFHMSYPEFRKDIMKLADNIEHGASRISTFVANLREFSQDNGSRRMVWLELNMVIEKVLSICRSQIKKRIKNFVMDIPEDQPPIYADEYSLEQILLNLIVNAVQAEDKPESWVKLSARTGDNWQDNTIIALEDNGCGIDEKTIGSIFDPFFTTKSASEGTGLGLYVSHNLVQRLGGRIEVRSRPKKGSTFTVYLPDRDRRKIPRT